MKITTIGRGNIGGGLARLWEQAGHEVTRLKRVSFGGIELGELKPGEWRVVSSEELRTTGRDRG